MEMASPLPGKIEAYLEGQVSGQVVVGHQNTVIHAAAGAVVTVAERPVAPRLRSLPVLLRPRPFPGLLDRERETGAAAAALNGGLTFELHGPQGLGKTSLLRSLAHRQPHTSLPDGIIHLSARRQTREDLEQALFEAFWETDAPFRPEAVWLRHALQQRRALVLLDDVDVSREEIEALLDLAPSCVFVLASNERRLWGEMRAMALAGLPVDAAVELVERELERPLAPEERSAAERFVTALKGHPLRVLQAVARMREEGLSLAEVERQASSSTTSERLLAEANSRSEPERRLLAVLAAVGGGALHAATLEALTEVSGAPPLLAGLTARRLVEPHGQGHRLSGELGRVLEEAWDLSSWREKAAAHFGAEPEVSPDEADAVRGLLDRALADGWFPEALRLARSVEGFCFRSVRWGSWALVLKAALSAAETQQDRAAEAWCLHQLGSRALVLGDTALARRALSQALRLRESLGNELEAAITRHNLSLLGAAVPEPEKPQERQHREITEPAPPAASPPRGLPASFRWLLAALVVLLIGWGGWRLWPRPSVLRPQPTPTPQSEDSRPVEDRVEPAREEGRPDQPPGEEQPPLDGETTPRPDEEEPPPPPPGEEIPPPTDTANPPPNPGTAEDPVIVPPPAQPGASWKPGGLIFGEHIQGSQEVAQTVVIESTGTAPLAIGKVWIDAGASMFTVGKQDCEQRKLPPKDRCTIVVQFRPIRPGTHSGELRFDTDTSGSPHRVKLSARVDKPKEPAVDWNPRTLDFGKQEMGGQEVAQTFMIMSAGTAPLAIGKVWIDADATVFTIGKQDCEQRKLQPKDRCAIVVQFMPVRPGENSGELRFDTDAPGGPHRVKLYARVERPKEPERPAVEWEPRTLDFGKQELGGRGVTQTFMIMSAGTAPLAIGKVWIDADASVFTVGKQNCEQRKLLPKDRCSIVVQFTPVRPGENSGELRFDTDAPGGPHRVKLYAQVRPQLVDPGEPRVRWKPKALDFGRLELKGEEVQNRVFVFNVGNASLAVERIQINAKAPGFSIVKESCSPRKLDPKESCEIVVRFVPGRPGEASGEIWIDTNAAGSPHRVPLVAQVEAPRKPPF